MLRRSLSVCLKRVDQCLRALRHYQFGEKQWREQFDRLLVPHRQEPSINGALPVWIKGLLGARFDIFRFKEDLSAVPPFISLSHKDPGR